MGFSSVPDVKCLFKMNVCYVYKQWYDISWATLYIQLHQPERGSAHVSLGLPERKNVSQTKLGI